MTKLQNFKLSKLAKGKGLLKLEFDTEDQVLFTSFIVNFSCRATPYIWYYYLSVCLSQILDMKTK